MPLHQRQSALLLGLGVDVGGGDLAQRVVQQHLADMAVDAKVRPGGTGHLAQIVTGPGALP